MSPPGRGEYRSTQHEGPPVSTTPLADTLRRAIAAGLLPADARSPDPDEVRPWPVVLLTGLGAWLVALPLLGMVGLLFSATLGNSLGAYGVGLLLIAGAVTVLRSEGVALFVEQLATPMLLVGVGALGMGLFSHLDRNSAAFTLALVAAAVAWLVDQTWLRRLLGAAVGALLIASMLPDPWLWLGGSSRTGSVGLALYAHVLLWLGAAALQRTVLHQQGAVRAVGLLEALGSGALLVTLVALAGWSGMSFLVGASLAPGGPIGTRAPASTFEQTALQLGSLAFALAAALWAARQWPGLRGGWQVGVALVLLALAGTMPALGPVLLVLAFAATSGRRALAASAALAAAWIVGAFYYQLAWTLTDKALLLFGAGALMGLLAWLGAGLPGLSAPDLTAPGKAAPGPATPSSGWRLQRWGIAATALTVLAVANIGIWQKEALIAHGQTIYIGLAPADPRSLMQGDFMRLDFAIPEAARSRLAALSTAQRPRVVARRDSRGVATLLRPDDGSSLGADELRIELTRKNGAWIIVSDAWFFKEGQATRWAAARFGEFRIDLDGRALLVGLRGDRLQPL